jgi:hypothetical protein
MPDYKFYIETINTLLNSDGYKPSVYVNAKGKKAEEVLHRLYIDMQNDLHHQRGVPSLSEIIEDVISERKK